MLRLSVLGRTLLLFIPIYCLSAERPNARSKQPEPMISRQVLVQLSSPEALSSFQKGLPVRFTIVDNTDALVILRAQTQITKKDLADLRAMPEVKDAQQDKIRLLQQVSSKAACGIQNAPDLPPDLKKVGRVLVKKALCLSSEVCPNNHKVMLWAQQAVDGDLMQEEMQKLGIPVGKTKVAVVDTGFDSKGTAAFMVRPPEYKKGWKDADAPEVDNNGHGTSTSSLIGAKDGIGLAPQAPLSVYSVSVNASSKVSVAGMKLAVQRACDDGNEVINLSIGASKSFFGGLVSWDILTFDPNDSTDKKILDSLAKKGCIVVESAGNSGTKESALAGSLSSPNLRVQATKPGNRQADFSSTGTVSAPGSGVYVLSSSTAKASGEKESDREKNNKTCGEKPGRFVDGTSFASPITAAIETNIFDVLKTSPRFISLPGPERIRLVNSILNASQLGGVVNGLRSVLIAKRWVDSGGGVTPDLALLRKLLSTPSDPSCGAASPQCDMADCPKFLACFTFVRRQATVCEPPKVPAMLYNTKLALDSGNLELGIRWLNVLADQRASGQEVFAYSQQIWKALRERWQQGEDSSKEISLKFNMDFQTATDAIAMVANSVPDKKLYQKIVTPMLADYVNSYYFSNKLSEKVDLDRVIEMLGVIADKMGFGEVESFIKSVIAQDQDRSHVVADIMLLDGMLLSSRFQKYSEQVKALDNWLYRRLAEVRFTPYLDLDPKDFETFLRRHSDFPELKTVDARIPLDLRQKTSLEVGYVVASMEKISPAARKRLGEALLSTLERGTLWSKDVDEEIVAAYFKQLKTESLEEAGDTTSALVERTKALWRKYVKRQPAAPVPIIVPFDEKFKTYVSRTVNPAAMLAILPEVNYDELKASGIPGPETTKKFSERYGVLRDQDFLKNTAQKAAAIIAQRGGVGVTDDELKRIVPYLIWDPNHKLDSRVVSGIPDGYAQQPASETLDRLLAGLIKGYMAVAGKDGDGGNRKMYDVQRSISAIVDNPSAARIIKSGQASRDAFNKLRAAAQRVANDYNQVSLHLDLNTLVKQLQGKFQ